MTDLADKEKSLLRSTISEENLISYYTKEGLPLLLSLIYDRKEGDGQFFDVRLQAIQASCKASPSDLARAWMVVRTSGLPQEDQALLVSDMLLHDEMPDQVLKAAAADRRYHMALAHRMGPHWLLKWLQENGSDAARQEVTERLGK